MAGEVAAWRGLLSRAACDVSGKQQASAFRPRRPVSATHVRRYERQRPQGLDRGLLRTGAVAGVRPWAHACASAVRDMSQISGEAATNRTMACWLAPPGRNWLSRTAKVPHQQPLVILGRRRTKAARPPAATPSR